MKKAFFLIPDFKNLYDDSILYIAEGLNQLGYVLYSNRDYWQIDLEGTYLLNYDIDFNPERDADIVFVSNKWTEHMDSFTFKTYGNSVPEWIYNKKRKFISIYIDARDGYRTISYTPEFRQFDYIFRSQYNKNTQNLNNIHPWNLGFCNRILSEKLNVPIVEKDFKIAVNFYYSHQFSHGLRAWSERKFTSKFEKVFLNRYVSERKEPIDEYSKLLWNQTSQLHNRDYFNNIERTLMVATFCGEMVPALPFDPTLYLVGGNKAKLKKRLFSLVSNFLGKKERIIQWDSWRFWETLALGSVPIHIDLEKYGVEIPVMPEKNKHYIGIDMDKTNQTIDMILDGKSEIQKIAELGYSWAIENYTPEASARRLIKIIGL